MTGSKTVLFSKGKELVKNKKGSFTVFAVMIFTAVIILSAAAVNSAADRAGASSAYSFARVHAKSILAEYDIFLKERYGILGFYGNDHIVSEKLGMYMDYSLKEKEYVKVDGIEAFTEEYSLDNCRQLEEQIKEAVLYGTRPKLSVLKSKSSQYDEPDEDRYIESLWIRRGLPSYEKTGNLYITQLVAKLKEGISVEALTGNMAADRYIFTFFKDYLDDRNLGETYFNCEIEYILSGRLSDKKALSDVKRKLVQVRNMLNLYYLYGCAEKRNAVMTAAQALTPGPAALLTQAVMMETWAYLEAENDIDILYSGETVPLLKDDSGWALSFENVFGSESGGEQGYIRPKEMKGRTYGDYLTLLLYALPEETKLLRVMDLIQINGKYLYDGGFLVKDYCSGLEGVVRVNGYEQKFKETYQ